jgi:RNA polymerase sigma-70 factor, ECF subfamily
MRTSDCWKLDVQHLEGINNLWKCAGRIFGLECYKRMAVKMSAGTKISTNGKIPQSLNLSRLMPAVYDELRKLARRYMAREQYGRSLQATALVNEAYLRLVREKAQGWQNRAHFCAIAAGAMREILVERARARAALKRGGSRVRVSLTGVHAKGEDVSMDVLALHEALDRLGQLDPELVRVVELRFFGGLTVEETAEALDSSPATIKRAWSMARAWLKREMEKMNES